MYAAFLYKVERSALKHCLELTLHAVDVVSLVLQEIAHPVLDRFEVDVAGLRDTQARDLGCSLENLRLDAEEWVYFFLRLPTYPSVGKSVIGCIEADFCK